MGDLLLSGQQPDCDKSELERAFPSVDPGVRPLGSRVLVQVRTPERKSKGGILLADHDRETQKWNTTVAKVIAVGPLAFKNRDTMKPWVEGAWVEEGDYVRVPKYGGDRWEMPTDDPDDMAHFVIYNDLDLVGFVTVDPLKIKAFF